MTNTNENIANVPEVSALPFTPKIIVFCCNWCSYAGADLAGICRYPIKPYFRVIRTMCSARVDPEWILEAFKLGADGVMVAGCHPGDCHYLGGNYRTRRRVAMLRTLISQFGLQPSRLALAWISAGEAEKFAATVNGFIDTVIALGPSPYSKKSPLRAKEGVHA
ncbi:MAG: hydrogenase iron-sulfur subunit [Chitinivibrionales bacterium]|nr:hydrogenase iron-sulfur subunit [Chitinivibrionales bacterium]